MRRQQQATGLMLVPVGQQRKGSFVPPSFFQEDVSLVEFGVKGKIARGGRNNDIIISGLIVI